MIMLHPDYRRGAHQEYRRTGQFATLHERRCGGELGSELRAAYPRESLRASTGDRATLLGRTALVLLFIMALVLRSLW